MQAATHSSSPFKSAQSSRPLGSSSRLNAGSVTGISLDPFAPQKVDHQLANIGQPRLSATLLNFSSSIGSSTERSERTATATRPTTPWQPSVVFGDREGEEATQLQMGLVTRDMAPWSFARTSVASKSRTLVHMNMAAHSTTTTSARAMW